MCHHNQKSNLGESYVQRLQLLFHLVGHQRINQWVEIAFGIPAILAAFGAVLWVKGFGPEDRELFRMRKEEIEELSLPDPSVGGDAPS